MVLGHARRHSLSSNRSSTEDARDNSTVTPDDETVVDSEQSNGILKLALSIMYQS